MTVRTDYSDCLSIHRPIHSQHGTDTFLPNQSVAWHPHASDGCDHVAVGTFCGKVIVTDVVTGTTVAVGQHAPEGSAVLSLKYSPCGKFLGVASGDGRFRTLDVYCGYKLVDQTDVVSDFAGETLLGQKGGSAKKADAGPDAMTHCDWSCDSRHVAINTAGGGLKVRVLFPKSQHYLLPLFEYSRKVLPCLRNTSYEHGPKH